MPSECWKCHYDLRGLASLPGTRCPECGVFVREPIIRPPTWKRSFLVASGPTFGLTALLAAGLRTSLLDGAIGERLGRVVLISTLLSVFFGPIAAAIFTIPPARFDRTAHAWAVVLGFILNAAVVAVTLAIQLQGIRC